MALVTLEQALKQIQTPFVLGTSPPDPRESGLVDKVAESEALVVDFINTTEYWRDITPTWDNSVSPSTVPRVVEAAVLLAVGNLWQHRGDDNRLDKDFWDALGRLLARFRDPVVA